MTKENVTDRLLDSIESTGAPICLGIDPVIGKIPEHIKSRSARCYTGDEPEAVADAFRDFSTLIIDAVADEVPAVKPNIAFFERAGHHGVRAYDYVVDYATEKGLWVITDGKRNDIGKTARAYSDAFLGESEMCDETSRPIYDTDMLTVNPYLGSDGIFPFFNDCQKFEKGVFVLVRTSNPSAREFQDKIVLADAETLDTIRGNIRPTEEYAQSLPEDSPVVKMLRGLDDGKMPLYMAVAAHVSRWGEDSIGAKGYSPMGAVVGATYPEEAMVLRDAMPHIIFLVPGYGSQGGGGNDVVPAFDRNRYGAIVNNSSGIMYAYQREPYASEFSSTKFADASVAATRAMKSDIRSSLESVGKWMG